MLVVNVAWERFGEDVCNHLRCADVFDAYKPFFDLISYCVVPNVDMLRSFVKLWIIGHFNGSLVIDMDEDRFAFSISYRDRFDQIARGDVSDCREDLRV